jgi:hypothetical protein
MPENMGQWIGDVMGSLGYVGLALLLVLENLFPPIPPRWSCRSPASS